MYKILDRELNEHKTVTFAEMCSIKNIKPKLGLFKRSHNALQRDRMNNNYLASSELAWFFKLPEMPPIEADNQPSSWEATIYYIEAMYGAEYAKGFYRADYPKLRKAA